MWFLVSWLDLSQSICLPSLVLSRNTSCASEIFKPNFPHESIILTYMRYSRAVLSKFVCAISTCASLIFFMLDVLFSRWVFIHLSYKSTSVIGMPNPEMKTKFTFCCQIINSLESVGMDGTRGHGYPWNLK